MNIAALRSPIVRKAIEAINNSKLDDFMALFATDATLVDGRIYRGVKDIRAWAARETFDVHGRLQVDREENVEGTVVSGTFKSTGYSGPSTWSFTLRGNQIEKVVIQ